MERDGADSQQRSQGEKALIFLQFQSFCGSQSLKGSSIGTFPLRNLPGSALADTFSLLQNDGVRPNLPSEWGRSRLKPGWKETTLYSLHRGDGNPPLTKVFTKSGEGPHPLLSHQEPGGRELDRLLGPAGKEAWPAGRLQYLSSIHPGPHSKYQLDLGSGPQKPIPNQVLFRSGSTGPAPKEGGKIPPPSVPRVAQVFPLV